MAYYAPFNKQNISGEATLAPGAVLQAEGQIMVRAPGATSEGVFPATAATATEIPAGFAIARTSAAVFPEQFTNKVEAFTVPSTGAVNVEFPPIADQVFVFDKTTGAPDTAFTVTGKAISGLTAGDEVVITYKYSLSVTQMVALFGNQQPGGYSGDYVGQVGLIKNGTVFTSEFDASVNWAAATALKVAPNGQVTDQTGTGAVIPGVVVAVPTELVPFLGIEIACI